MPIIRIHRGELSGKTLLGRGVGVDRLPVGSLGDREVTEVAVPAGTHVVQIRNGVYFSRATRYTAGDGDVLDFEIRSVDEGLMGLFFGGWIELVPIRQTVAAPVDDRGTMPVSRIVESITVLP